MSMFNRVLAVTNRTLCAGDFLHQIEQIAAAQPAGLILREKDLPESDYQALAARVLDICAATNTPCMLHNFAGVAHTLRCPRLHVPLAKLQAHPEWAQQFDVIGVSIHSASEAICAQQLGASYVTAGHVFLTDCKKGVPARGLTFLCEVCQAVDLPVYAIGGITPQNMPDCLAAGAAGVAVMSGVMNRLADWCNQ